MEDHPMRIDRITLRHMALPLKHPFETSFSRDTENHFILVEVESGGVTGFGEVVADYAPLYSEENTGTCWHILSDFLIPYAFTQEVGHPSEVTNWFRPIRRNKMAKSGLEGAIWDLWAKLNGQPLAKALGGSKERIEVGVSVGIDDIPTTLGQIEAYLAEGYRRVKVKIKPGHDVNLITAVRKEFGDIPLMADANSAYTLDDLPLLKELDQFGLMMVEQPLAHDDIIDHATLQRQLNTPICLDESIHSPNDARKALDLGACRIINIKVGRVGGLTEAIAVHDLCLSRGIPVWCGGMLESGIGRAHNIAITSLPGFTLPGDTSPSRRYWTEDIIEPAVTMSPDGTIEVPRVPGLGYEPAYDRFPKYTKRVETFRR
jgi:O-succinylbenzoate synthase